MPDSKPSYGVMLPLELRDRCNTPGLGMMSYLSIVKISDPEGEDPCGVRKGTILSNPRHDSDAYADLRFCAHFAALSGVFDYRSCQLEYHDVFHVDYARACRMAKLLSKIRSAQEKFQVIPPDLGQYVALLAPAVGIHYMVVAEDEKTEAAQHYPTGFYRIRPIRDVESYLRHLVASLKERYQPPQTETVHC